MRMLISLRSTTPWETKRSLLTTPLVSSPPRRMHEAIPLHFSYDSFGNLIGITDSLGHSATLAYDAISRLTSVIDPNGHATSANFDALSRLIKIADPLGNKTQFAYDGVGNLLKITDANGIATTYAYDAANNLIRVTDGLGHSRAAYLYDPNDNRVAFANAKGNVTVTSTMRSIVWLRSPTRSPL